MKAVILAGGLGTRISEETSDKPKPMVLLEGRPVLWHLMKIFELGKITRFVIAAGYKSEVIAEWVSSLKTDWEIDVMDTGLNTQTGGRLKLCMEKLPGERIIATYGDGLANVNIGKLVEFHERQEKFATITAVRPPARFGVLKSDNGIVTHFGEKDQTDAGWINGGFFVLEPQVRDYIKGIGEPFETGALPRLVADEQLAAFHHNGFWKPMDTLREKLDLEKFAQSPTPPWLAIQK
jgi:glucose-1-phosphate cytidylyltransferase